MFPMRPLPDSHVFLGPVLWAPDIPRPSWWNRWETEQPSIYVTLGSTGAADTLPTIVGEIAELPLNVLVATAGRLMLSDTPSNVYVADYLPGLECARLARAVVCNGGSATAYQGIANGRPVVGLWTNPDQELTTRILQQQGAGLSHPAAKLEPGMAQELGRQAVMEGKLAKGAEKLAERFAAYDAGVLFNRFLDRFFLNIA
jgi:UDP:flavonoid glycosyltransferase YjiC (YdhE family)